MKIINNTHKEVGCKFLLRTLAVLIFYCFEGLPAWHGNFFVLRIILHTCKEIIRFSTRCNYQHFKLLQELTFILFDQYLFFTNFFSKPFLSLSFQLISHRAVLPPPNTAKLSAQRKKLKLQDKYSLKF